MESSSFLTAVEDESDGGSLSTHSCLGHSLYTSCVRLHPPWPRCSQMSNLGKHGSESTRLWLCAGSSVCPPVASIRWRDDIGWMCSLSGVSQPVSVIHHGHYPAGARIHGGKCIHIHHQLGKVARMNHIYTIVTHCTHTHTHAHFATLCSRECVSNAE